MIRVQNDNFGRAIHELLYQRILTFCKQYTPEIPAEQVVMSWLNRMYNNDQSLHILVEMDNWIIVEHAVIEVQEAFGNKVVFCHQVQRNKANIDSFDVGMEYIEKLVQYTGAMCSIVFVQKHSKVLERKYGYKIARVAMVKYNAAGDSVDQEYEE